MPVSPARRVQRHVRDAAALLLPRSRGRARPERTGDRSADGVAALVAASLLRDGPPRRGRRRAAATSCSAWSATMRPEARESGEATPATGLCQRPAVLAEARHAELAKQARPDDLAGPRRGPRRPPRGPRPCRVGGNGPFVVRLAGALAEYWRVRGPLTEGRPLARRRAPDATVRGDGVPGRALHGAGVLALLGRLRPGEGPARRGVPAAGPPRDAGRSSRARSIRSADRARARRAGRGRARLP